MSLEKRNKVVSLHEFKEAQKIAELERIVKVRASGGEKEAYDLAKAMLARLLKAKGKSSLALDKKAKVFSLRIEREQRIVPILERQIIRILNQKDRSVVDRIWDANLFIFKYSNSRPLLFNKMKNFIRTESKKIK